MAERNRSELKSYFQTGDRPTQTQFAELIDSFLNKKEDGVIVDINKNIGIGFLAGTSLTAKLEVDGDIKATNLELGGNIKAASLQLTNGAAIGEVLTSDGSGNGTWMPIPSAPPTLWTAGGNNIYRLGGNVGIGLNNPSTNLEVNGKIKSSSIQITSGAVNGRILTSDGSGNASWQAQSFPPTLWTEDGSNIYRSAGKVGIGIANPSHKLHIVEDYIPDELDDFNALHVETTHSIPAYSIAVYGKSNPTDGFGYGGSFEGGDVGVFGRGVGTGSDDYYGVVGRATNSNTGTNIGVRGSAYSGNINYGVYGVTFLGGLTNYGVYGSANNTNNSATNYGVYGNASYGGTNYAVYANGDAYSTTSWNSSDKRFKKNITAINQGIDIIKRLNPVSYDFHQEGKFAKLNFAAEKQYGFLAQELETVLPSLVRDVPAHFDNHLDEKDGLEKKKGAKKKAESKVEYYKGTNYIGVIPIAIKAIQEQQTIIEDLQARLKAMENQ